MKLLMHLKIFPEFFGYCQIFLIHLGSADSRARLVSATHKYVKSYSPHTLESVVEYSVEVLVQWRVWTILAYFFENLLEIFAIM